MKGGIRYTKSKRHCDSHIHTDWRLDCTRTVVPDDQESRRITCKEMSTDTGWTDIRKFKIK